MSPPCMGTGGLKNYLRPEVTVSDLVTLTFDWWPWPSRSTLGSSTSIFWPNFMALGPVVFEIWIIIQESLCSHRQTDREWGTHTIKYISFFLMKFEPICWIPNLLHVVSDQTIRFHNASVRAHLWKIFRNVTSVFCFQIFRPNQWPILKESSQILFKDYVDEKEIIYFLYHSCCLLCLITIFSIKKIWCSKSIP